jgi:hypothetical protein
VHGFATTRAKHWLLAAPARLVLHINITRDAASAAPERLLGASAGERGAFFAAAGALARHLALWRTFFCLSKL